MVILALVAVSTALAGDTLWTRTYSGAGATMDRGSAVATIGDEIYVAGHERLGTANVMVIRYHANGDMAWVRTFDIDTEETINDAAVLPDSSLLVCVKIESPQPSSRVIKLSKSGDTVWTRKSARLSATNLALNDSGDVFVFGSLFGAALDESLCLIKYKADGTQDWRKAYHFGDRHTTGGCCADEDGNIIAVSQITDTGGFHATAFKFTPAGDTAWRMDYPELTGATMGGVAIDAAGLFVFTVSLGSGLSVVRCSTNGSMDWNVSVPLHVGPMTYNTVACDADTNVVVCGQDASNYMAFAKLDKGGSFVCIGRSEVVATPYGVAVDVDKRPIVTGQRNQPPPSCCFTAKFTGVPGVAEQGRPAAADAAGTLSGATVVRPGAALSVKVSVAGNYSVVLLDVRGAVARRLHNGQLSAGVHRFNPGRLAAGSYYLKIAGGPGVSESKIVQVR
jgi:hypothetical protein